MTHDVCGSLRCIHEPFERRLRQAPQQVFVLTQEGPLTFADLDAWAVSLAREMRDRGVRAGDRVLIVAENCPQHISLIIACSRLGAWSCGVNARMAPGEIDAFVAKADARLVYFTEAVPGAAAQHARRLGATASAVQGLSLSATRSEATVQPQPAQGEVAAIIFTSGTTGEPKGVPLTHAGLLHYAQLAVQERAMTARDRVHAYLPMTHIFGLGAVLMASLMAGSTLVMRSRFDPADVFDALAQHGVSMLQGPAAMFTRLLAWLDTQGVDRPSCPDLRYLYAGAAPLDLTLKRAVERRLGLPLFHGYGMSEYAGGATMVRLGAPRDDVSSGPVLAGAELRIVDTDNQNLPQGEAGEIWLRGIGLMPGYFRDAQATAEVMRPGGWYASGDIGRLDADGALFVVGRLKEMIVRSGFNVYPGEVEAVLSRHPAIRSAAVVGRRCADGNEEVLAFVECSGAVPFDAQELSAYLARQLAPYKLPSHITVVDALPTTLSGKVLKRMLRLPPLEQGGAATA